MFQLGGSTFPTTREELIAAVTTGLRGLLALPANREVVKITPAPASQLAGPAFDCVLIDLTGAKFSADQIPPEPKPIGPPQPAGVAAQLEISGHPLYVREAAVDLSLTANNARFNYDRDASGRAMLVLADAKNGAALVQIRRQDLDALVLAAAREGAKAQGVQILETQLTLTQINERNVSAEVRVKAKKMFMTATLHLRGTLGIDQSLNAKISDLTITGEGMLGDVASAGIRPHLQAINGRVFPLAALPLGDVRLRDLRLQIGDMMKVTAAFGS